MAEYEEKFIVINRKRLEELRKAPSGDNAVAEFLYALDTFNRRCEVSEVKIDQKYIVCNLDEPYARSVLKIILEGEEIKEL